MLPGVWMRAIWVVVLAGIIGASHGLSARIVEAPCKGVVFAMNEREFFTAYARCEPTTIAGRGAE